MSTPYKSRGCVTRLHLISPQRHHLPSSQKFNTIRCFARDPVHVNSYVVIIVLLLVNSLLCLICKLNFIIVMYV